jgi:DNA-binding NarL/FixJ family response regulator
LLSAEPDCPVIEEAADAFQAVQKAAEAAFDVVLMDISLPGMNGIEATRVLKEVSPHSEVLFLSQHSAPGMVSEALQAGGRGYVVKTDAARELVKAIRTVAERRQFLSSSCACMFPLPADTECNVGSSEL